ncbi:centromere-associated protein E [Polymixia lowei]
MTEESAVKVCVRVRPLIEREETAVTESAEPVQLYWKAEKKSIQQIDDGNPTKTFSFDRVFSAVETTNQLYQDIAKPLVVSAVEGYNGTIFAYGQTSSGKTFTMMGSDLVPGVIPLAMEDVFQTIKNFPKKEFLLRVSYMEIYNETVTDLLVDSWKRKPLEVREAINKNIYVADLTEELVTSPAQALAWIRKGEKNRHYGKTKMNQRSSRSHTIFRMILESRERSDPASGENADGAIIVSHLNLVDLAGSERASQTGAEGTRFKEGCNINRSLFILGQVIKKLSEESQRGFTNYRDSKLTRILQNSLGGNAKTVIICTITPATVDETLSTLQFASTAKNMKNDPHVTEVSDDGALLKRYRNEIVDLKRRLHEVSSVTQTTATEKETLSQLLQEKDQLQREQEDRIKNLTKLLVTSSNFVLVKKMPKRRVTWGGKLLRLTQPSDCDVNPSDLSFAEPFSRKRKADQSCLTELAEDDEDFDSRWEIPESAYDMEMNQNNVTLRSNGESPKEFVSPNRMHELSDKVSNLELQLEAEISRKDEALAQLETLGGRVAELELQLETAARQQREVTEVTERRAAELDLQHQAEAHQKLEAVEMLEFKVLDLERQLQEQAQTSGNADEQMRKEFTETIQLCETLVSEKEVVAAELDYLKQELDVLMEQTDSLEKEKAALKQELEENKDLEEFKSLEDDCWRAEEKDLQNEILSLKKAAEAAELKYQELEAKLGAKSEELKRTSDWAEELQSLNDKDLVQQVTQLRRSLDDAEGVSRDTKKEWAFLRSQNIALKERDVELTASYEKMEAEVSSLRVQLEADKSRNKKMQADLQKELNVAFDENTKLTVLLDGKVPKNLIDSVELERRVANLNKELAASCDAEEALRAQLEELASLQHLPEKVNGLMKQVCELTEELCAVQTQRDALLSAHAHSQEEAQQLRDNLQSSQDELLKLQGELSTTELREQDLVQRCSDATEQVDTLRSDLARADAENNQLLAAAEETNSRLEESSQQQASLEDKLNEMQQLVKDLEEKLSDSELTRSTEEEIGKELQEQLSQLTEELQSVQAERDGLLSERTTSAQSSSEETETLLSKVTCLTEERDQLKMDMQENVEMMIENQEELRTALEKNREQKERIKHLEAAQMSSQNNLTNDNCVLQLEELQNQMKTLTEELESLRAERDGLLSEKTVDPQSSSEELEKLLSKVTSLTEERDQLQEILEGLRQEKNQLKADLEDKMEMVVQAQTGFTQHQMLDSELQAHDEQESQLQQQLEQLHTTLQTVTEQKNQLERDLQRNVEMVAETQGLLQSLQEQLLEQKQVNSDLERLSQDNQTHVEQQAAETRGLLQSTQEELQEQMQKNSDLSLEKESQIKTLTEELESLRAERDGLLSEKTVDPQSSSEELEKLLSKVTSLIEERDQLQEILEGLRQEKNQLKADLEEKMEMIQSELQQQHLSSEQQSLKEEQEAQRLLQIQQLQEQLQSVREERSQLKTDLQENVEMMIENQEELREAQEKIKVLKEEIHLLNIQKTELENRTDSRSPTESTYQLEELQNQIQRLTEELESLQGERDALLSERTTSAQSSSEELEKLLSKVTSLTEERDQLQEILEGLRQEKNQLKADLEEKMEMMEQLRVTLLTVTEQKSQAESDLQSNMEMAATAQGLLHSIQDELREQKQVNSDLEKLSQEKESHSDQQIKALTEKLESIQGERDGLLSERMTSAQSSSEELEKLLSKVTSLTEERDQLQEILEGLRQEKNQLKADLEDKLEMISAVQERLNEQEHFNLEQKADRENQEALFQQEIQQLKTEQTIIREERSRLQKDLQENMEMVLQVQTSVKQQQNLNDQQREAREQSEAKFRNQVLQLEQELDMLRDGQRHAKAEVEVSHQSSLMCQHLPSLPKPTLKTYTAVRKLNVQTLQTLGKMKIRLNCYAQHYKEQFQDLVQKDLAVFEERRLQDVLLCMAQAPSYSVKEEDLQTVWENRLSELLDKREVYLQKMAGLLERLWASMSSYRGSLSDELGERETSNEQLRAACTNLPLDLAALDGVLSREFSRCSLVVHSKNAALQDMLDEHIGLSKELELLREQSCSQLREERSKTATLLQVLESAPVKTEVDLLKDNQQLVLQLQQSEKEVKAMHLQIEQLEEAQVKARDRVSNHKQATQLLQTELQDTCAKVQEKENAIQTLRNKLRQTEAHAKKNASPSAIDLDRLRDKVVKLEVELTSASSKHREEIQKMTTLLNIKEDSLRKLKETLRNSQQHGEESFLQGEDLYARLTQPKGCTIQSSIHLEKTKLEEEVKQFNLKIAELESSVSSQQAEIAKWKSRAVKLKEKSRAGMDKPSSPCTPSKRRFPMASEGSYLKSPKRFLGTPKLLDSPKKAMDPRMMSALDSPKNKFFDVSTGSESLSRNCPKQFFDNSNLGTLPDAATSVDKPEEWWPLSPTQADMCKAQ